MDFTVTRKGRCRGECLIPGDKSISHRAIMLASLAEGHSDISGFLPGEDNLATLRAFAQMGVSIKVLDETRVGVEGRGLRGLKAPNAHLDMGNSGTSIRLLSGILSGQPFCATLVGDESLNKRPMGRVIDPLSQMGAKIKSHSNKPPLTIEGTYPLKAIDYVMPVASAQVKSSVLLAGLYADGETSVTEPAVTRDHTERMLDFMGYPLNRTEHRVSLAGGHRLKGRTIQVPGDFSSAAFFIVAGLIAEDAELYLPNVGINPTRIGLLELLQQMGAHIDRQNQRVLGQEPVADIVVKSSALRGIDVPQHLVASAIDEFPIFFIAAACAKGETRLRHAEELRVKESDRLASMARGLRALGIQLEEYPDGLSLQGGSFSAGQVDSFGDHRIAMAFTIAALRAEGPVKVMDCRNIATSFPTFSERASSIGLQIEVQ